MTIDTAYLFPGSGMRKSRQQNTLNALVAVLCVAIYSGESKAGGDNRFRDESAEYLVHPDDFKLRVGKDLKLCQDLLSLYRRKPVFSKNVYDISSLKSIEGVSFLTWKMAPVEQNESYTSIIRQSLEKTTGKWINPITGMTPLERFNKQVVEMGGEHAIRHWISERIDIDGREGKETLLAYPVPEATYNGTSNVPFSFFVISESGALHSRWYGVNHKVIFYYKGKPHYAWIDSERGEIGCFEYSDWGEQQVPGFTLCSVGSGGGK